MYYFRYIHKNGMKGFFFFLECRFLLHLILFLTNHQTNSWTILHSHQQYTRVPVSPCLPTLVILLFILWDILVAVKSFIVILNFISLMTSDVKHLFICLLYICLFLWRNVYIQVLCSFLIGFLSFCCCLAIVLYVFWIQTLIWCMICKYFL